MVKKCKCCGQNIDLENKIKNRIDEIKKPINLKNDNWGDELSRSILYTIELKVLMNLLESGE